MTTYFRQHVTVRFSDGMSFYFDHLIDHRPHLYYEPAPGWLPQNLGHCWYEALVN